MHNPKRRAGTESQINSAKRSTQKSFDVIYAGLIDFERIPLSAPHTVRNEVPTVVESHSGVARYA